MSYLIHSSSCLSMDNYNRSLISIQTNSKTEKRHQSKAMHTFFVLILVTILARHGYTQVLPQPGVCGIPLIKPKSTTRIVNGEAAIPHSRPYQLLLVGFFPNGTAKAYCGASLITTKHVLTAAHCVAGYNAQDLRIFPGLHNFTSYVLNPQNGIPVQKFVSHESYNAGRLTSDVAIIRLARELVVDNHQIGLICLPEEKAAACGVGHPVVASGWGATTGDPNRPSNSRPVELQQVDLQCVDANSNAGCKSLTYLLNIIREPSKMCAYNPGKSVCFGDSGGPLVREKTHPDGRKYFEQVGIMSGTKDCSFTGPYPDIYADVIYFMSWITKQVQASP
ncbi:unnamed protein product [Rotaria sordida]|uniref:Peptidase S1 domain-containing protein n=1 Tax=Rotaria sordida TaxID=392033 RepID=A0A813QNZ5_9BILA|nr:unnamed protein product [Rotaria sordida]CAF0973908.1 unnamed protein product [Rotaria sordida]